MRVSRTDVDPITGDLKGQHEMCTHARTRAHSRAGRWKMHVFHAHSHAMLAPPTGTTPSPQEGTHGM